MRILSITQVDHLLKRQPQISRKAILRVQLKIAAHPLKRRSDGGIVGCGRRKRFLRQPPLRFPGQRPARVAHLLGNRAVIGGRSDDRDILKILRRRTDHRRPTNIDVFNQLFKVRARLGRSFLKGVQVNHHHVDGRDAMLGNRRQVPAIFPAMQYAPVHLRMQRLDAPVQHFRESGQLGDVLYGDAGIPQQLCRASGRNQFHAKGNKFAGEL